MNKEKEVNQEVALNYIDKVASSTNIIGKKLNRTIGFLILSCVILLGLNFDIISISNKIPILGIDIQVTESVLILIMCCCCYLLQVHMFGLGVKESENIDILVNLYKKLGYYDESMNMEDACLIQYPIFINISFSKRIKRSRKFANFLNDSAFLIFSVLIFILVPLTLSLVAYQTITTNNIDSWNCIIVLGFFSLSVLNFITGMIKWGSL